MYFKRKIFSQIDNWVHKYPNYALFIKGARRVGKTTLAEHIGEKYFENYVEINFQEASGAIKDLFIDSLMNLDYFYNVIQAQYNVTLTKGKSLIILDEIQLFPAARQALKTLLNDGRYSFIETGSLASITKKSKQEEILIPSEEYAIELFPMDFEEFLWANGDTKTIDILRDHLEHKKPLGQLHRQIKMKFREYLCVGGMPQAVNEYIKTKDFEVVNFIKKGIIELYKNDIKEQDAESSTYVNNILDVIPSELTRHTQRASTNTFKVSHINKNARVREYAGPFRWLQDAYIINLAFGVSEPSAALNLNVVDNSFKVYMMDTGLLINLAYDNSDFLDNDLYKSILLNKIHVNEGMVIENVIAQQIVANGHKNEFYIEYDDHGKLRTEVDFLLRKQGRILPIEVKSGKNKQTRSLDRFCEKFNHIAREAIVLHDGEIQTVENKLFLPYYMTTLI